MGFVLTTGEESRKSAVELRVDPVGSFNGYGIATIRGTVSRAAPAPLGSIVIVELSQVGRQP